jgi:Trk-type K+ transport system membrane component
LWIVLLAIGTFALQHFVPPEYTLNDIILEAASALGNKNIHLAILKTMQVAIFWRQLL